MNSRNEGNKNMSSKQEWKNKFIKAMISMGSPYIGALTAIEGNTQGS